MANTVAKYQKYTEYKESGVEWLGEIPRHWDSKPLKYLCTYNVEVLPETTAKDAEIQYIDIGSVSAVNGISKIETMIFKDAPSRARRIVRDGDVIVSTVRTYLEAIAPINNPPENLIVSTGFAVIRPNQYLYKSFASYCLRAKGFIKEVVARSVGVSYPAINSSDLVNIAIPSIEYAEQVKIANFLDHETTKIDHLIEKQQQLIELLKEKRQAVISHAVTKGLDPNVPMKDSGVAWLGEVPEHWGIWKFAHIAPIITCGVASTPTYVEEDVGMPFLSAQNIKNNKLSLHKFNYIPHSLHEQLTKYRKPELGDILVTRVGAGIGEACIVDIDLEFSIYVSLTHIRVNSNIANNKFVMYFFGTDYCKFLNYEGTVTGGGVGNLNVNNVVKYKIALPSLQEQQKIVEYIDHYVTKQDELILKAESAISLMQERRTALISAAVTGKIDVRNWQSPTVTEADTELSA
ncbi:restriction endonuclease subunit S [Acinetobacter baumannii]|uniref:restriction endonuclease subunit S n=1 Tax=Acinetobacter baumannii TaxID=470 RepID=UPI000F4DA9A7|nr:restriction endonuclease subunit S [Acinetobacter baumannii]AYY52246.1 restriction endonuclease subunit S [Acinetobacter baumannii]